MAASAAAAYAGEAAAAVSAVVRAARVCERVRTGSLEQQKIDKDDASPVTVADYAAQAVVISELNKTFGYPTVGEENADALRGDAPAAVDLRNKVLRAVQSELPEMTEAQLLETIDRGKFEGGSKGRFFCLDPIDGTKGFLRNDQYAVALGLIDDSQVVMGVLGCPNLQMDLKSADGRRGVGFVAIRGQGCHQFPLSNPEQRTPVRVSAHATPAGACVVESIEAAHTAHDLSSVVASKLDFRADSVRMDSQAKYGALARGDAEVYLRLPRPGKRYEEKIWDHAAGMIVVEEAGGKVTDVFGKPLDFSKGRTLSANTGVVGSNGLIHDAVIEALASVEQ